MLREYALGDYTCAGQVKEYFGLKDNFCYPSEKNSYSLTCDTEIIYFGTTSCALGNSATIPLNYDDSTCRNKNNTDYDDDYYYYYYDNDDYFSDSSSFKNFCNAESSAGLSSIQIAGIVIGSVIGASLIGVISYFLFVSRSPVISSLNKPLLE